MPFHLHQNYKMSPQLSQKLKNISFLLMIFVAFIHSYNLNVQIGGLNYLEPPYWLRFLESFISDGVCRVAVPMFFAISGYLACEKIGENFTWAWYGNLLKKKFFSLLIPYLLVSAFGILLVVVLQLIPFSRPYFNNFSLENTTLNKWIWIWLISPVPFQLWFVRFLILHFLVFPFFYYPIKYFKIMFLMLLFAFWFYIPWQQLTGLIKIEFESAFFFCLGLFFSIFGLDPCIKIKNSVLGVLFFAWIVWIFYRTGSYMKIDFNPYHVHYHIVGITFSGLFIFWWSYDFFQKFVEKNHWITANSTYSFGIFLFHEPFLTIIKKIMVRVLGTSAYSLLFIYVTTPVIAILFGLYFSKFLQTYLHAAYVVLTGSRSEKTG